MIALSATAAAHLHGLIQEKGLHDGTGLRLAVEKGGCAGLQYAMTIAPAEPGDLTVERDGAQLFIDTESIAYLDGCEIDYEESLSGAGFRVNNPKAARSCGCGTSFEPAAGPAT